MKRLWIVVVVMIIAACSGGENDSSGTNDEEKENKESVSFRQIDITTQDDDIHIEGEVKSWDGMFYYHIVQGEKMLLDEKEFDKQEHKGIWTSFSLELDRNELDVNEEAPHIVLYGKNEEDETINPNYVPIDLDEQN